MEITAWEIYWVMQLDSIRGVLGLAAGLCGTALVLMGAFIPLFMLEWDDSKFLRVFIYLSAPTLAFSVLIGTAGHSFLPSSKTAAAMIVVPAIVNSEAIQDEAGEIYQLAKQALRDVVSDDEVAE